MELCPNIIENHNVVLCTERFTPNTEPTYKEIQDYAEIIGVDCDKEDYFLPLVKYALMLPLPKEWTPCYDLLTNRYFYFNVECKISQWEHPLDNYFRNFIKKLRTNPELREEYSIEEKYSLLQDSVLSHLMLPLRQNSRPQLAPIKQLLKNRDREVEDSFIDTYRDVSSKSLSNSSGRPKSVRFSIEDPITWNLRSTFDNSRNGHRNSDSSSSSNSEQFVDKSRNRSHSQRSWSNGVMPNPRLIEIDNIDDLEEKRIVSPISQIGSFAADRSHSTNSGNDSNIQEGFTNKLHVDIQPKITIISSKKKLENSDRSDLGSDNKKDWTESGVDLIMKEDTERSSFVGNTKNSKHVDETVQLSSSIKTEIHFEFTKLKEQLREEMDKSTKEMETVIKNECNDAYKEVVTNFKEEMDLKIDQYRKQMEKDAEMNNEKNFMKERENISRDMIGLKEELLKDMSDKEITYNQKIQKMTEQCKNDVTKFIDEKFEKMIKDVKKDVNELMDEKISKIINSNIKEQQVIEENLENGNKNKEDTWIAPKSIQEEITKLFKTVRQENGVEVPKWAVCVEDVVKRVIDGKMVERRKIVTHSETQTQDTDSNKKEMSEVLCMLKEIRGQISILKSEREDKSVNHSRLYSGHSGDVTDYLTRGIEMKDHMTDLIIDSYQPNELQKVISKANKAMEEIDRELNYCKDKYLKNYNSYMSITKNHKFH